MRRTLVIALFASVAQAQLDPAEYKRRVETVTRTSGFVALWDFVKRDPADSRFDAWKHPREKADLRLDVLNYVRIFWNQGREANYNDLRVLPGGPFGQAIEVKSESDPNFRPILLVPRDRLHNSGLDIKGPGQSVTLVVWIKRTPESGTHAVAGIWHEGTDLKDRGTVAQRVERGKRQYALFGGLAANPNAAASHLSDNGASSFDDRYARHLSATPEKIPINEWSTLALVFDNKKDTVTTYLNGKANELWIENPGQHPFFQWAARAWERNEYRPPKQYVRIENGKLTALKANPYWFPHDLYSPATGDGGPFTIGRVIHTSRNGTSAGIIGGVAVFNRALKPSALAKLALPMEAKPFAQ